MMNIFDNRQARQASRIKLGNWTELEDALRNFLQKIDYSQESVCVRFFERNRISTLIKNGTDRDSSSTITGWPEDFKLEPAIGGYDPGLITYGREFNVKVQPYVSMKFFPYDHEVELSFFNQLEDTKAIAVYAMSGLRRVGKSGFVFQENPQKSLLAVFEVDEI